MAALPVRDRRVPHRPVPGDPEACRQRRRIAARAEPHHDVARAAGEGGRDAHRVGAALAHLLGHEDVVVEGEAGRAAAPLEELAVAELGTAAVARAGHRLEGQERAADDDEIAAAVAADRIPWPFAGCDATTRI